MGFRQSADGSKIVPRTPGRTGTAMAAATRERSGGFGVGAKGGGAELRRLGRQDSTGRERRKKGTGRWGWILEVN